MLNDVACAAQRILRQHCRFRANRRRDCEIAAIGLATITSSRSYERAYVALGRLRHANAPRPTPTSIAVPGSGITVI